MSGGLVFIGDTVPQAVTRINYFDIPFQVFAGFLTLICAVIVRFWNNDRVTSSIVVILVILFSSTTYLNSFLSNNWRSLGFSHNYFRNGYSFLFLHWTLPITMILVSIIFGLLIDLFRMLTRPRVVEESEKTTSSF